MLLFAALSPSSEPFLLDRPIKSKDPGPDRERIERASGTMPVGLTRDFQRHSPVSIRRSSILNNLQVQVPNFLVAGTILPSVTCKVFCKIGRGRQRVRRIRPATRVLVAQMLAISTSALSRRLHCSGIVRSYLRALSAL